jgi:hypothetical protein
MKPMRAKPWFVALGLMVMTTSPVEAQVIKGTMSVTGAEMS